MTVRNRRVIPSSHNVPPAVLLPAVRKVCDERGYSPDSFSDYDVEQVRSLCGPAYSAVPLCDVRQLALRLRKKGLIHVEAGGTGQPKTAVLDEQKPRWYFRYLMSEWWLGFRRRVLRFWSRRCCLCNSLPEAGRPGTRLDVHHRRYRDDAGESILGRETVADCLCLCRRCHKRHHRYMETPPSRRPGTTNGRDDA